jgi:hypothetical protein
MRCAKENRVSLSSEFHTTTAFLPTHQEEKGPKLNSGPLLAQ